MPTGPIDRQVGPSEAAERLGVDRRSIQRWIDEGALIAHKTPGGHRRILERDLLGFARRHELPFRTPRNTVLLVDDDPDVLESLSVRIRSLRPDLEVHTAHSGVEAGASLAILHPVLVFLDIRMPGVSGIEVCRMIRDIPAMGDTVVVGITASTRKAEADALRKAGAADVLKKPLEKSALLDVLNRVFPAGADPYAPPVGSARIQKAQAKG